MPSPGRSIRKLRQKQDSDRKKLDRQVQATFQPAKKRGIRIVMTPRRISDADLARISEAFSKYKQRNRKRA